MKQIFILAICMLSFTSHSQSDTQVVFNNNPTSSDDYYDIVFSQIFEDALLVSVTGRDLDFNLVAMSYEGTNTILEGTNAKPLAEFDYNTQKTIRNINNINNNNSMVLEARDTSGQDAYGFMYITPNSGTVTPTQTMVNMVMDTVKHYVDSTNIANNQTVSSHSITTTTEGLGGAVAYIISFDQPDPYESGYTSAELDYEYIYNNSATDYLEKILDTDRNDELVGFRYYSNLNNEEYTIFIKANN